MKDLISKKAFDLGQIVYSEKQREKFEQTISDQLTGLEIFSAQRKIDEFSDLYGKLLAVGEKDKAAGAGVTPQFTQEVCESIARTLMEFDSEKEKQRRLEMAEKLFKRILENQISLGAKLFDSLVFVFTESQQWRQLTEMLSNINPGNCQPEVKTLNYLKKNLLYCFEPQVRAQLKEQIERLEDNFFAPANKPAAETAEKPAADQRKKPRGKAARKTEEQQ